MRELTESDIHAQNGNGFIYLGFNPNKNRTWSYQAQPERGFVLMQALILHISIDDGNRHSSLLRAFQLQGE